MGTPKFVANWYEVRMVLGTPPNLQLVSESWADLAVWRTVPLASSLAAFVFSLLFSGHNT